MMIFELCNDFFPSTFAWHDLYSSYLDIYIINKSVCQTSISIIFRQY